MVFFPLSSFIGGVVEVLVRARASTFHLGRRTVRESIRGVSFLNASPFAVELPLLFGLVPGQFGALVTSLIDSPEGGPKPWNPEKRRKGEKWVVLWPSGGILSWSTGHSIRLLRPCPTRRITSPLTFPPSPLALLRFTAS